MSTNVNVQPFKVPNVNTFKISIQPLFHILLIHSNTWLDIFSIVKPNNKSHSPSQHRLSASPKAFNKLPICCQFAQNFTPLDSRISYNSGQFGISVGNTRPALLTATCLCNTHPIGHQNEHANLLTSHGLQVVPSSGIKTCWRQIKLMSSAHGMKYEIFSIACKLNTIFFFKGKRTLLGPCKPERSVIGMSINYKLSLCLNPFEYCNVWKKTCQHLK